MRNTFPLLLARPLFPNQPFRSVPRSVEGARRVRRRLTSEGGLKLNSFAFIPTTTPYHHPILKPHTINPHHHIITPYHHTIPPPHTITPYHHPIPPFPAERSSSLNRRQHSQLRVRERDRGPRRELHRARKLFQQVAKTLAMMMATKWSIG